MMTQEGIYSRLNEVVEAALQSEFVLRIANAIPSIAMAQASIRATSEYATLANQFVSDVLDAIQSPKLNSVVQLTMFSDLDSWYN